MAALEPPPKSSKPGHKSKKCVILWQRQSLLAFRYSFGYHISQKLPSNRLECVKRQETRVQHTNPAYLSVARRDVLASKALKVFWRLLSAQIADKCFSDSESSFVCKKFESILPTQGERIFYCPFFAWSIGMMECCVFWNGEAPSWFS